MKCCAILALASGAYAVQDTTPPVITLSLATVQPSGGEIDHHVDSATHTFKDKDGNDHTIKDPFRKNTPPWHQPIVAHATAHDAQGQATSNSGSKVTCEVDSNAAACPLPTCTAHDHHDGALDCTMHTVAVNVNNQIIPKDEAKTIPFTRNLRAEFLLKYDAVDAAGNEAETVSFTMIFHDVTAPTLTTEWGTAKPSGVGTKINVTTQGGGVDNGVARSETESCSMEPTGKVADRTAPCTWTLAKGETAEDDYDGDVTDTITRSLTAPGGEDHTATFKIDTQTLGIWKTTADAHDHAGIFGLDEEDNKISQKVTIVIVDTTAPTITSDDWDLNKDFNDRAGGHTLECGVDAWADDGANCWDTRDQWSTSGDGYVPNPIKGVDTTVASTNPDRTDTTSLTINAAASQTTEYTVTYSCKDDEDNPATPTVRKLVVQDTRPPTLALKGSATIENSAGDDNSHEGHDADFEDKKLNPDKLRKGFTCTDECDSSTTTVASLHYGKDCTGEKVPGAEKDGDNLANFPEYTAGDYSVKYVCSDGNAGDERKALTSEVCRNIQNVDHTLPMITILGSDHMTLEATHTGNYVDDGAVCSDQVDGVISQNVEVSGDVVNLSKAGAYDITYNCKDSAGNSAPTVHREVTVKQTTCPTCALNDPTKGTQAGKPLMHEASFPYTDAGVVCSDLIDGTLTEDASYDITNPVNVELTGDYVITYRAKNSVPLWNDDASCRGTATTYTRTVRVKDTLKPIIRIAYNGAEVARSAVLDTGIPDSKTGVKAANPMLLKPKFNPPTLMAEQQGSAVSAWAIAAAASAVTGLALLGYSSSRVAVATSVPV